MSSQEGFYFGLDLANLGSVLKLLLDFHVVSCKLLIEK